MIHRAEKAVVKKNINKACKELINASIWAYKFNAFYSDKKSEEIIKQISEFTFSLKNSTFIPRKGTVVFYDCIANDNGALTKQYVDALIQNNIEFLFIYENKQENTNIEIDKTLRKYSKVQIYELDPKSSSEDKMLSLFNEILNFKPEKALLHLKPWTVDALCVFNQFPQVERFNINLTDHVFWLGTKIIDYNIEFRDYGATVSFEKRGFKKEQLLKLPYYPITANTPFQGFPDISLNKTVIFSGGSPYKIYGENGFYFKIIKRLLDENRDTILLYAGAENSILFKNFIAKNNFEDRVVLLRYRKDINAVFKNCDIYLGTYPIAGGLMSQFAAVNGKPILAYTHPKLIINQIEGFVCHTKDERITFYNLEEFYKYANLLCNDSKMRDIIGNKLKECVISEEQFAIELKNILFKDNTNGNLHTDLIIDYEAFFNLYLEVENFYNGNAGKLMLIKYKILTPLLFPKLFLILFLKTLWNSILSLKLKLIKIKR
jgi:hypothetical protein